MNRSDYKYSVITGFLGGLQDRFIKYAKDKDMEAILETAANIKGCSGVEVIYPQNFTDAVKFKKMLDNQGLECSSVNLNLKSEEKFKYGSITNPDPAVRKESVKYLKAAMDASVELGSNLITVCPLGDGSDYPFEFDYVRGFNDALECVSEAAEYRDDVKISLEYKLNETRMHCILPDAGKTAYFCNLVDKDNVGVTVDIGHSLLAGEVPADSIGFLGATDRLFYVHINDNYRNWDWDMVPGTVNFWDYIEVLLYLEKVGYKGWITADVFPQRNDQVKVMEKTFEWMDYFFEIAARIDHDKIFEMMNENQPFEILDYVRSQI
ncbi:hypothetical protein HSACCH_01642 [Halanaerobium saccharolyticum subsp. saccharolyticum DSM 6643]|uniref:Xylose isomerase-like TIM barrel domain-containing protein n=1 Tax=Halanaerobium saccharolyticum subsp. saccharolyticum DSM 6643 TaxID=1293054 RepID=M5E2H8_9FIRM|nr:sugar phosphate isomerase/epimerase family protein [Halanaerobium saccharolyticum]CCU79836.1 hypothetical protein HSACCH_01642 [Halanaerobium saccharolyticum subsp. saccharolyticum DSM 6643]